MSRQTKHLYEFGNFTLDVEESRLLRDGLPVPLKPKVLETLFVLVESSGHVIGKKELMQRLWPDSFVEEANLAVNISQLRKALGDDESGDHFIETVPKRGYRFAAQVTRVLADRVDLIVHERTRSHIVIDEEETSADGISVAKGTERFPAVSRRVVILPTSRTPGGSLLGALEQYKAPLLVIVACITIGVVVLAVAINRLLRQNAQKGFH
ncbi:MAG TPA: transcriptional regulator, partial [Pyrinomonadaceae bacterium]|nr:transcriptional regulator [Pyrinomonadaceae bacterium]